MSKPTSTIVQVFIAACLYVVCLIYVQRSFAEMYAARHSQSHAHNLQASLQSMLPHDKHETLYSSCVYIRLVIQVATRWVK